MASRVASCLIAATVCTAGASLAQERAPVDQAASLREAQRIVKAAEGDGVFVAATDSGGPLVKHPKSGLICHFELTAPGNEATIFDKGPNRGSDVGCATRVRDIAVSIYANRVSDLGGLDQAEAGMVASIRKRWSDVTPYRGQAVSAASADRPPVRVERFIATLDGKRLYTRAAAMQIGEWVFTQRITAPEEVAMAGDLYGELVLTNLAKEIAAAR